MAERRGYPWHVWGTGAVLAAFAGFCVWLLLSVMSLRANLEANVGELVSLQREQRAAAEAPLAPERVTEIDSRVRELRRSSAGLSEVLWRRWTALYAVVATAVVIGFAYLVLLVVAHRRRVRAEASERALAQRYETLERTAKRLAEGDLDTPVQATGAGGYDEFEQALEDMRGSLVERIAELAARNVEIEALADNLRAQIAEHSSALEHHAVTEMTATDSFAPGAVFAERYRIVRPIGAGGVGDVYRIERISDGKALALKLLRRVRNAQHRARFAREAKLLAALEHDNVVGVHHIGVSPGGSMFLVMDLVSGENLAQRRDRRGDVAWTVAVLERVARALAAIHAGGLVHRDIKPANIVVGDDPSATVLVDFGIARELDSEDVPLHTPAPQTGGTLASFQTQVGMRVGTPMYMAPELGNPKEPAAPAADVFAFGVTAYKVLSGATPFRTPPVDAGSSLPEPRHVGELCPDLARDAGDAIMRCLAADPAARPTAAEVADALAASAPATAAG